MSRQAIGATILLVWAGSLVWLARRDPAARASTPARPRVAAISPASAYYRLILADSIVGFAMYTVDTSTSAVELVEQLDVRLPDGDSVRHVFQRTSSVFSRQLAFVGVDVTRRDGAGRWTVAGRRITDSAFSWRVTQGADAVSDTVLAAGPAVGTMASVPLMTLRGRPPRVGYTRTMLVADPLRRSTVAIDVTIAGDSIVVVPDSAAVDSSTMQWVAARWDTLRVWRVTRRGNGAPLDTWVDEDGFPVLGDLVPGVRLERLPYEIATTEYRAAINRRFVGLGARVANRIATAAPPTTFEQRLLLPPVLTDTAGWLRSGLQGGGQRLSADTLDVRRLTPEAARTGAAPPSPDNALVPSGAPEIAALAGRLKGSETDGRRIADRILKWVRTEVTGTSDSGAVDARQALRRRRGGPSNRAAVFAGLAQAAGLEARVVSGLVAVSDGGWARHAWAEVLLGDWVPIDPTYGTFPAGGGYVRLLLGAPADPLYLVPLAASLDPERLTRQKAR